MSLAAEQCVIAHIAAQGIAVIITIEQVGPSAAEHRIPAGPAVERVIS